MPSKTSQTAVKHFSVHAKFPVVAQRIFFWGNVAEFNPYVQGFAKACVELTVQASSLKKDQPNTFL